jgi:hypothetical protein
MADRVETFGVTAPLIAAAGAALAGHWCLLSAAHHARGRATGLP